MRRATNQLLKYSLVQSVGALLQGLTSLSFTQEYENSQIRDTGKGFDIMEMKSNSGITTTQDAKNISKNRPTKGK